MMILKAKQANSSSILTVSVLARPEEEAGADTPGQLLVVFGLLHTQKRHITLSLVCVVG